MLVKSSISYIDQITIEAALCNSALVSSHQKYGLALWIECKSNTPYAPIGIKTKFLHIRVARTLERIYMRPSKERSFFANVQRQCDQFALNHSRKIIEFRDEVVVEDNLPLHFRRGSTTCSVRLLGHISPCPSALLPVRQF